MALSNCPRCGSLFNKQPNVRVCKACQRLEDEMFDRVYEYLRNHPGVEIKELSVETEVEERLIVHWYEIGRLVSEDGLSGVNLRCQKCGLPLASGRLCRRCSGSVKDSIANLISAVGEASESSATEQVQGRGDISHETRTDKRAR